MVLLPVAQKTVGSSKYNTQWWNPPFVSQRTKMPGFHPTPPEPNPEETPAGATPIGFGYMKMRSPTGHKVYAMTFQQMIQFFDNIMDQLEEEETSAMYHFQQMKRILRKYIQDGD
jgi:hypothetical protein